MRLRTITDKFKDLHKNAHIRPSRLFYASSFILILILLPIFIAPLASENQVNDNLQTPDSTAWYDYRIWCVSLSIYSASHGDTVTLNGWAEEFNGANWVKSNGEEIIAVIDGVERPEYNDLTNGNGNFSIVINVEDDLNIHRLIELSANVSDDSFDCNVENPQYLDVNAGCEIVIDDSDQLPALKYSSKPYPTFTNYRVYATMQLDNGSQYAGPSFAMNLDYGTGPVVVTVNETGECAYNMYWTESYTQYQFSFAGNDNLTAATTVSANFKSLDNITIDFLDTESTFYHNNSATIRGRVSSSADSEVILAGQTFDITFLGETQTVVSNEAGVFTLTILEVPNTFTGLASIRVRLVEYDGETVDYGSLSNPYIQDFTSVEVKAATLFDGPNALPIDLIIIIIVIIAGVIGVVIFMRWRLKQESEQEKQKMLAQNINRLDNVSRLWRSGRYKEAVGYLWVVYADIAATQLGLEKKPSHTPKNYAMMLVKERGQNPASVYGFIQKIEQAVYGDVNLNDQFADQIIIKFKELYHDLTGSIIDVSL